MDSFSTRLALWLAANQAKRREGLAGITLLALFVPLVSWKAFIIIGGLLPDGRRRGNAVVE